MRNGKILSEDSPQSLLEVHNLPVRNTNSLVTDVPISNVSTGNTVFVVYWFFQCRSYDCIPTIYGVHNIIYDKSLLASPFFVFSNSFL